MKKLLILTILFAPILGIAQESTSEKGKFSIGLNFSPNYSYRTLKYSDDFRDVVDYREEFENPSFGFNTGIAAQYLLTEKLEIELGVQFSRQTSVFNDVPVYDFTDLSSTGASDVEYRFHYIEVPLRVNYRILNEKFFGYVSAGISINQFLNDESKTSITYNDGDTEEVKSDTDILDFNKTAIGVLGGVGIGCHINEKLNVRLEPLFRYSLIPVAEAPIDQYNYSIGCQLGINMKL